MNHGMISYKELRKTYWMTNFFENGIIHYKEKNYIQSYKEFIKTIHENCEHADAYFMLGIILQKEQKNIIPSIVCLKRAIDLNQNISPYHYELAVSYNINREWNNSIHHLKIAINLDKSNIAAWHLLSHILIITGQIIELENIIKIAIEINPNYEYFQWIETLILLTKGNYDLGFKKYNKRKLLPDRQKLPTYPEWDGEIDLTGKLLLIIKEQGLGDMIQFSRFLDLIPKNINFVCAIQDELLSLFQENFPNITFCSFNNQPIADYYLLFGDLINIVKWGRTPETLPFKKFNVEKNIPIHKPKGIKKSIGIVWGSSKINDVRSSTLETFYKNLTDVGIELYSLQLGQENIILDLIHDMAPLIKDFSDTAAIIKQLDHIVCVDTSIGHLAGSMEIPCSIIISEANIDWRWFIDRTDSPWYPSITLYRKNGKNWDEVLQQIKKDILL